MGKSVSFKGIAPEDLDVGQENGASEKGKRRRSSLKAADLKIDPMLWGQPGHLTEEEADTYVSVNSSPMVGLRLLISLCCRISSFD